MVIHLLIFFLFLLLTPLAAAQQPQALPGLGSPTITSAPTVDITFPRKLMTNGDKRGALLAWQRVAHEGYGQQKALALFEAGRLAARMGDQKLAATLLRRLLDMPESTTYIHRARYWLSRVLTGAERDVILLRMTQAAPENLWTQAAVYRKVWDQTFATGTFPQGRFANPDVQNLRAALASFTSRQPAGLYQDLLHYTPGATFLWQGDFWRGLLYAGGSVLALWLLALSLYRRQWSYVLLWGIVASGLTAHHAVVAPPLMQQHLTLERQKAMQSWTQLHPTLPQEEPIVFPNNSVNKMRNDYN